MTFLGFSGLVNFITCISIAIFVIFRNIKSPLNISFFNLNFSVAIYSFGYLFWQLARNETQALFWFKILVVGIILINITYLYFVFHFLGIINRKRNLLRICTFINFIFIVLNLSSRLYTHLEPRYNLGFWPVPTVFFHIYLVFWFWQCFYGFYWLLKGPKIYNSGIKRQQVKYFTISAIFGFLGGATNWPGWYNIRFPPYLNITISLYIGIVAYAIFRYRFLDIKVALTRAGIFAIVYTLVLGIPFWFGLKTSLWVYSTIIMAVLATTGPFAFIHLSRKAEARFLKEERRGRELLKQASEGMMRIRSIKRLVSLMVHVTCKILKLDNAAVFLLDEEERQYKLEAVRLRSKYGCREYLQQDDVLIQRLSALEEPLVYEEIKTQAQNIKDKSSELIREISSQMESLSATLIIPASSRGRLLGFLALGEKKSKRMYSHEDLSVLWVVSNQAALAIENAQFHKKAQEALLREDREMTARFIGHGASHQFGNVLNRIIQRSSGREMDIAELDLNTLSPDELKNMLWQFREDFHAITNAGMQGKEIVSGILSLGAGSPVDFKQEDLKAIIQRSVQTIKLKQSKANIQHMDAALPEILADIPDTLPKAWCNSLQIEQVLENMLDNALEAIEEKESLIKHGEFSNDEVFRGKVLIKAGTDAERISLEILDNGIGIKQGDLKNMFTPFFTTKATERLSRKGHGIGMHMVKEILRAHQGKIYVAGTEFGKGTTFRIEFPLEIAESKKL